MKVTIFGTGYVGLVTAGCLAHKNHEVLCYDTDNDRIKKLDNGLVPIFEPGLDNLQKDEFFESNHNLNLMAKILLKN